jgi:integrase/recombinase XerD
MLESLFRSALVRRRMAASHLSIILENFVLHLELRGHVLQCIQSYAQIAEHFFCWLGDQHLGLKDIDNLVVERFVISHLPRCKCPKPAPTCERNCRAALGRLLEFLRRHELILRAPSPIGTAMDLLLQDYDQYMRDVHGLAEATRHYRRRYARQFLQATRSTERLRDLRSTDIGGYIKRQAGGLKPCSMAILTTALRSFMRFLAVTGRVMWPGEIIAGDLGEIKCGDEGDFVGLRWGIFHDGNGVFDLCAGDEGKKPGSAGGP